MRKDISGAQDSNMRTKLFLSVQGLTAALIFHPSHSVDCPSSGKFKRFDEWRCSWNLQLEYCSGLVSALAMSALSYVRYACRLRGQGVAFLP